MGSPQVPTIEGIEAAPADISRTPFYRGLRTPQEWMDGILPRAPGFAMNMVKHELLTTLRDFCAANTWLEWSLEMPVAAGDPRVPLVFDGTRVQSRVLMVYRGRIEGVHRDLVPADPMVLDPDAFGPPRCFYQEFPGSVMIHPAPDVPYASSRFWCSLQPNDLQVPEWFAAMHFEVICDGVLARLFKVPSVRQDLRLAATYEKSYGSGRSLASVRAKRGFTQGGQGWSFPLFGR